MKAKIAVCFIFFIPFYCSAQLRPVNDTLIPEQHKRDTIQYEPKLQGGALIDTVNSGDKEFKHFQKQIDTLKAIPPKKDSSEYKMKGR